MALIDVFHPDMLPEERLTCQYLQRSSTLVIEAIKPSFFVAIEYLVASLARDTKLTADTCHLLGLRI